eukprot:5432649-Alexandrium_andersonii.AAC.1
MTNQALHPSSRAHNCSGVDEPLALLIITLQCVSSCVGVGACASVPPCTHPEELLLDTNSSAKKR